MRAGKIVAVFAAVWACSLVIVLRAEQDGRKGTIPELNSRLAQTLTQHRFTGRIESTLESRLGRAVDQDLANLGRLLWFDNVHSLHRDNTCAGCHAPSNGFGDTQSIAIGVDNNGIVGSNRTGPRNQRRSPMIINTAFYPKLMWNGRFFANPAPGSDLGDPFSKMFGFSFPAPEGETLGYQDHLLQAQAFIPPTELVEVAGFTGTSGTDLNERFAQFDNGRGLSVPRADESGFRNHPIRMNVLEALNAAPGYRLAFGRLFPEVAAGEPITFDHFARAIAEFEFTLVFADAPIDRFARGNHGAMTAAEKRGALVFFGKGNCVSCHAVSGQSNEMFSDFQNHVIGVPQIAPFFGVGRANMIFDGPDENEDFGAQQISGQDADRYMFRTAPLRNIAVQPAFFHNGSFTSIEGAIRHHLDPVRSARTYNPKTAGIDKDLMRREMGPIEPVLERLDPALRNGIDLTKSELNDLTQFVTTGLLDARVLRENLCSLVPRSVPSGLPVARFEGCTSKRAAPPSRF
jgi:cytochrome c peroxidase